MVQYAWSWGIRVGDPSVARQNQDMEARGAELNRPTRSEELLAQAALLEAEPARDAWRRWKQIDSLTAIDYEARVLLPLLYRNVRALEPEDPELPVLKGAYRHAWFENQRQLARAGHALRILAEAGFETLVLKGAALTVQCYRDHGLRPMADVDVMVRTDRARDAAELLCHSGWRQAAGPALAAQMPIFPGTLFLDDGGGKIDLHWHSLWSPSREDDFWDAAVPIAIAGAPTLGQCPADHLLQVCVHGVWSGEHQPLRWLADAMIVLRSSANELDWDRLVARARARSLTLPVAAALRYLRELVAAPIPEDVVRSLAASPRGRSERTVHWAWTGTATRSRRAVLLADNYRRRRALPPSLARPSSLPAYIDAYARTAWGVERMREVPVTAIRRFVRRELYAG
jgi:hypothetical protein